MATASMSPAAKRCRLITGDGGKDLQRPPHLASLSGELLLIIGSCLSVEDTVSLCQVSKSISNTLLNSNNLWRTLALNVDPMIGEAIFASLSSKNKNITEKNNKAAAASLWRRIALSRERARQQSVEEEPEEGLLPNYAEPPPPRPNLKPWSSYSFILDMENVIDCNKNVSIFLENAEENWDVHDGTVSLKIHKKYLQYFPWANDLPNPPTEHWASVTLDTTFTVYVIDRATGKQTKVYYSRRQAKFYHARRWAHYVFPKQDCGKTQPVPFVSGLFCDCWKETHGEDGSRCFLFDLGFRSAVNGCRRRASGDETLLFLEKGLVYV